MTDLNTLRTSAGRDCFAGNGEMAIRMQSFDWSQTPIGPVECWPQSLKTALPHHAHVTVRDVDGLGAGAHLLLQRRLRAHSRDQAKLGPRLAGEQGLGRDLA